MPKQSSRDPAPPLAGFSCTPTVRRRNAAIERVRAHTPWGRAFGLEVEYGCLVRDDAAGPPEAIAHRLVHLACTSAGLGVFEHQQYGRKDDLAPCGGFLVNGGRLYVDAMGDHLEYATPECASLYDLVAQERAGQHLILALLDSAGLRERVSFHNNSVDHYTGHTFGCHENYSLHDPVAFYAGGYEALVPFLVTRQLFAGAGRVGGHRLVPSPQHCPVSGTIWPPVRSYQVRRDRTVRYQLSQRADHICSVYSPRVRFHRALINPKVEAAVDDNDWRRLHLLFGEANMSQMATMLKIGTIVLALDLVEDGLVPPTLRLAEPIAALRAISRSADPQCAVSLANGMHMTAIEIQRYYCERAARFYAGRSEECDLVLREWACVLDDLETPSANLADRLDWAAKQRVLELYLQETGRSRRDSALYSVELEYHNIDPAQSLFFALEQSGAVGRVVSDEAIRRAMHRPPPTRARLRGEVVRRLAAGAGTGGYRIEWGCIRVAPGYRVHCVDPLCAETPEGIRLLEALAGSML
jgi:proteasome accessory factor A